MRYYVRAQDVNPTGLGITQSDVFEVEIVRRSVFHLDAIDRATAIEAEARIAWDNQLQAWLLANQWAEEGTGEEDDELWREMTDKQSASIRAARTMNAHLRDLINSYQQNEMEREFMSGRINDIVAHLRRVIDEFHREVDGKIREARPSTSQEAMPANLLASRREAHESFKDPQLYSLLHLERVLRRLFDWRDLQMATVRTTLLHDEQEFVHRRTGEIAPDIIGVEIEDLPDETVQQLVDLGSQQRTIFDMETELENQLSWMIENARVQGRQTIRGPLEAAYGLLRRNRVNEYMRRSAQRIESNQPYQILDDQENALHTLNIVLGGLVIAGREVDEEAEITLAMSPSESLGRVFEVAAADEEEDPDPLDPELDDPPELVERRLSPEEMIAALPVGVDKLSAALDIARTIHDRARARTEYLAENMSEAEMPRYVLLKRYIIQDFQSEAITAADMAAAEAEDPENEPIRAMLTQLKSEFEQSLQLVQNEHLDGHTQRIQSDSIDLLDHMLHFLSFRDMIADAAEENRQSEGKDVHDRLFVVRGENLDVVEDIVHTINHASMLQNDVLRKARRFDEFEPGTDLHGKIEQANLARAQENYAQVGDLLTRIGEAAPDVSEELQERMARTGVSRLGDMERVALDLLEQDADAIIAAGTEAASLLTRTNRDLHSLLREWELTEEEIAATEPIEFEEITEEEFRRRQSFAYLRSLLEEDERLSDEVRAIMLRALEREDDFPKAYQPLISAYYGSFLEQ